LGGEGYDIAGDSVGNIFAVGYIGSQNVENWTNRWIVRKSSDGGENWVIVRDYILASNQRAQAQGVAIDSSDNIYVLGQVRASDGIFHWQVQKSSDGGDSWSITYDLSSVRPVGMKIDKNDNIYIYGVIAINSDNFIVIERSTDGGNNFTRIEYFNANRSGGIMELIISQNENTLYYVGGIGLLGATWLIRGSTDNGANWSTLDTYEYDPDKGSIARGIVELNSGVLIVTGSAQDSNNIRHWVTRKSSDNAQTWATVDDYLLDTNNISQAVGLGKDLLDNVYAIGEAEDGTSMFWTVRKSDDEGESWTTQLSTAVGNSYTNGGIGLDVAGNLYMTGNISDIDWNDGAFATQKLDCN